MKDIPGFEGRYAVTKDGRVWAYERRWKVTEKRGTTRRGHWVKGRELGGYINHLLIQEGRKVYRYAHVLVAHTYIENPAGLPCVNHIDSNRKNNKVSNLEWCTHRENSQHMVKQGRQARGSHHGNAKLKEEDIQRILSRLWEGRTKSEVATEFGVSASTIARVANQTTWSHISCKFIDACIN